jgi:hypothetical protein
MDFNLTSIIKGDTSASKPSNKELIKNNYFTFLQSKIWKINQTKD